METEHELRILEIEPAEVEAKILAADGRKVQDRSQQSRYTYNVIPEQRAKWVLLRTNGTKSTLAIKHVTGDDVSDTKEVEVEVGDFQQTAQLMIEMGMVAKSYQENFRTIYELNGAEIMIDEWPLIPPYVEIEAATPTLVHEVIQLLGYKVENATGLDVSSVYEQIYNIDIDGMPELKFDSQPKAFKTL